VTGSFRDSTCSILCDVDRDQSKRLPMMNAGTRVPVPVKNCIDPLTVLKTRFVMKKHSFSIS